MFGEKFTNRVISNGLETALNKLGVLNEDSQGADVVNYLKKINEVGVAVTCNFMIIVTEGTPGSTYVPAGPLSDDSIAAGYQSFNVPDNGFKFQNAVELGYQVVGSVPPLEPVTIQYWDYGDLELTRKFNRMYDIQRNKSFNLLKPGYNCHTVKLIDAYREVTLFNVAVSQPKFEQARADAALKLYSVVLTYDDYDDVLVGSENTNKRTNMKGNILI